MSEALAHVYDLALRALAEQERQVAELRGRLTPILASGGLGATLMMCGMLLEVCGLAIAAAIA